MSEKESACMKVVKHERRMRLVLESRNGTNKTISLSASVEGRTF
jgi:hypothetical protein